MAIVTLALRARDNDVIEFHPSQVGKSLYPYRDGALVGFWTSIDEARANLPTTPLLLPLMTMFDVGFITMEDVHQDLAGKQLAVVDMTREPPHLPFDLVYEVGADDVELLAAAPSPRPPAG